MKASEARNLVKDQLNLDENHLKQIYEMIKFKSKLGFMNMTLMNYYGIISIISKLEIEGYKCVLIYDFREGDYWEISWEN